MLQNYFTPELEQLNLKDDTVFQQHEAPYHFALHVRQFLSLEFPNRLIGRNGQFSWPLCSLDFTPLDFLWKHVKTIVCATKPSSFEDLKAKIIDVILGITINQLTNHLRDLQNRITLCIANDGGLVEASINFIKTFKNLDFLFSNFFYRLFLPQIQIKL